MTDHDEGIARIPEIRRSDGYKVPWAILCDAAGEPRPDCTAIPSEAVANGWYRCPACSARLEVVVGTLEKSQHFRHPFQTHTCNTDNYLHEFAISHMRRLIIGAQRGLVDIDIEHRGKTHRLPIAEDVLIRKTIGDYNYDLVLYAAGEPVYLVEIFHMHQVDRAKAASMPCSWSELAAKQFLRPDIKAALARIDAGLRCVQPLVLKTIRHKHRDLPPTGGPHDPDPPPDKRVLKRVLRALQKLAKHRPYITLCGTACPDHPQSLRQWTLPNTQWDELRVCTGSGTPHVELQQAGATALALFFAGDSSLVRGVPGRELSERRSYPFAIISTHNVQELFAGRPTQVNAHAISDGWSCPQCVSEHRERVRRARVQEQQARDAEEAKDVEAWVWRMVQTHENHATWGEPTTPLQLVTLIENHLARRDAIIQALVPGTWYARALERDRRYGIRQGAYQVWSGELYAWAMTVIAQVQAATDSTELRLIATAAEGKRPRPPDRGADVQALEAKLHGEVDGHIAGRRGLIEDPNWQIQAIWDRFEKSLFLSRTIQECQRIQQATETAYRTLAASGQDIADAVAPRLVQVQERCAAEITTTATRLGDALHRRIAVAFETAVTARDIAAILARAVQEANEIPVPVGHDVAQAMTTLATARVLRIAEQGYAAAINAHPTKIPTILDRMAGFRDTLEMLRQTADVTNPQDARLLAATLVRHQHLVDQCAATHARHVAAGVIWGIWGPYRDEVMSRFSQPWGEQNTQAVQRFRAAVREHGHAEVMLPEALGKICSAIDAGDFRHLRGMCRDAQRPADMAP